jgi:thiol-disulfide isomerase/thioredoxin
MEPTKRFDLPMRSLLVSLAVLVAGAQAARAQDPPAFPDLEFAGAEGGAVRLSQLKGNLVLLNVWATWCGPCRMELPVVQRMYDKYSDRNFVVLAINVDADRQRVAPFMKRYNISLPVYFAAPEDAGQMTTEGIPTSYLLSADRHLLHKQVGFSPSVEEHWKDLIEKNLRARKPAH